jgi:hypothetical protein
MAEMIGIEGGARRVGWLRHEMTLDMVDLEHRPGRLRLAERISIYRGSSAKGRQRAQGLVCLFALYGYGMVISSQQCDKELAGRDQEELQPPGLEIRGLQ